MLIRERVQRVLARADAPAGRAVCIAAWLLISASVAAGFAEFPGLWGPVLFFAVWVVVFVVGLRILLRAAANSG